MDTIRSFKKWLIEEGKAVPTIDSYVGDVKGFRRFIKEKAVDNNQLLSRFAFVRYKQYLLDSKFKVTIINKKINSLKVYNDFLQITS